MYFGLLVGLVSGLFLSACSHSLQQRMRSPASLESVNVHQNASQFNYLSTIKQNSGAVSVFQGPLIENYQQLSDGAQIQFKSSYNLNTPIASPGNRNISVNPFFYQREVSDSLKQEALGLSSRHPREVESHGIHLPFSLFVK